MRERQRERDRDKQRERESDRQTDRQTAAETERQTDRDRYRQRILKLTTEKGSKTYRMRGKVGRQFVQWQKLTYSLNTQQRAEEL